MEERRPHRGLSRQPFDPPAHFSFFFTELETDAQLTVLQKVNHPQSNKRKPASTCHPINRRIARVSQQHLIRGLLIKSWPIKRGRLIRFKANSAPLDQLECKVLIEIHFRGGSLILPDSSHGRTSTGQTTSPLAPMSRRLQPHGKICKIN
jgi:hypothetical protein